MVQVLPHEIRSIDIPAAFQEIKDLQMLAALPMKSFSVDHRAELDEPPDAVEPHECLEEKMVSGHAHDVLMELSPSRYQSSWRERLDSAVKKPVLNRFVRLHRW